MLNERLKLKLLCIVGWRSKDGEGISARTEKFQDRVEEG